MFIPMFWCGVIATILFEVAVPVVHLIITSIVRGLIKIFRKDKNEQDNT